MWPVLATGIMLYLDGETMVSRNPTGTNHVLGLLAVAVGVASPNHGGWVGLDAGAPLSPRQANGVIHEAAA